MEENLQVRHLRMANALAGYREQPEDNPLPPGPEHDQVHQVYLAGQHRLAVKQSVETPVLVGESFITSKAADKLQKGFLAAATVYVLWLVCQAVVHFR